MEKNPDNLWTFITNPFSILTWVTGTKWLNLSLFSLKKKKQNQITQCPFEGVTD